jgi:hypothetical protein
VGDESHFVFCQKLLSGDGSVKQGVIMVKQPGLFLPKFRAMSSQVFTQSPQNVTVEPRIHSLACWDRSFALPQVLYRWRHQSRIFWIPPCRRNLKKKSSVSEKLSYVAANTAPGADISMVRRNNSFTVCCVAW